MDAQQVDAQQVTDAFAAVRQRYDRTPCRSCRSHEADALIAYGMVLVTCRPLRHSLQ
ncbi:hypothetical protein [Streptomyces sp. I6]|uniref:hypothetical protein n=1 Tax=Streptomyces sp. I6 TaxID=2483113 RepID=UPI0016226B4F|nr:hypothetical protein [Streptomyces sp. I6]